jgi:hypothetical protein
MINHPSERMKNLTLARAMAGVLAAGGTFWGLFLLPFVIGGLMNSNEIPLSNVDRMWIAGYLVTMGYYLRFFLNLPLLARRSIWFFSTLVQGVWLSWYLWGAAHGGARASAFEALAALWWFFSLTVSLIAFCIEPKATSA